MKKPKDEVISITDKTTVKMSVGGMPFPLVSCLKHMKRIQKCKGKKKIKSRSKELSAMIIPG